MTTQHRLPFLFALLLLLVIAAPLDASTGGVQLAWNEPIQRIADNLTGPTAKALLLIGVFAGGVVMMFGGWDSGTKKFAAVVVSACIIVSAAALLSQLGISATVC